MIPVKVDVFSSPGCSKCGRAMDVLHNVVKDFTNNQIELRKVNIMEEMDYAMKLGVLITPAIAIDGKLVFSGLPSARKLKALFESKLSGQSTRM